MLGRPSWARDREAVLVKAGADSIEHYGHLILTFTSMDAMSA